MSCRRYRFGTRTPAWCISTCTSATGSATRSPLRPEKTLEQAGGVGGYGAAAGSVVPKARCSLELKLPVDAGSGYPLSKLTHEIACLARRPPFAPAPARQEAHRAPPSRPFSIRGLPAIATTAFGTPALPRRRQRFARPHVRTPAPLPLRAHRARVFRRPSKPAHPIAIIAHGLPRPALLEPARHRLPIAESSKAKLTPTVPGPSPPAPRQGSPKRLSPWPTAPVERP